MGSPLAIGGEVTCRGDYGVAAEHAFVTATELRVGAPGFTVQGDPATVESVVAYRFQPDTPCPPPILL